MSKIRIVLLATLGLGACSLLVESEQPVTLTLRLYSDLWRNVEGKRVRITNNSATDPAGLAGLEVEIDGIGVFSAADIEAGRARVDVPDSGWLKVAVRLAQGGRVVARGAARWLLEPKVEWSLGFDRAPSPRVGWDGELTDPSPLRCISFWCRSIWRYEIDENVRNYPDEALWMALYRVHPDECVDVC